MASNRETVPSFGRTFRQILLAVLAAVCVALFALWRIDSPRVERLRMALIDTVAPSIEWSSTPFAGLVRMAEDFQSYSRVYEQNEELRRELQRLRGWREAAVQLEQENARLRALNNVHLSPRLAFVTGEVVADSGGPFLQSALLNIGERDGVEDGSAAVDGLGLVGRVSGVGRDTARVIFLTDANSRVPVIVKPSGRRAIISGDNTDAPRLDFLESVDQISPGDRVVTSGDGGIFPPDLLVGQVVTLQNGTVRVRLAADYRRLEFLRVLRFAPPPRIEGPGGLILPGGPIALPELPDLSQDVTQ
ncbi:rod shape-determining protein MreC [Oceanicella sp. SM1341]|uniref:rod shape-determining protein MreC n=1 Tax=Oceanicella sp. SM1341 TaxID=1548889 RepID=UPI000E475134|nr:rod shape-determining protein MreC [Oceanicella sp. SM1341]